MALDNDLLHDGGLRLDAGDGVGLVPDLTGTKPLLEIVGHARALDITATARVVEATGAHDIGPVNVPCEPADLDARRANARRAQLARLREMAALLGR